MICFVNQIRDFVLAGGHRGLRAFILSRFQVYSPRKKDLKAAAKYAIQIHNKSNKIFHAFFSEICVIWRLKSQDVVVVFFAISEHSRLASTYL